MSDVNAAARLTVDLEALASNYSTLSRAAVPGACGAVVKANAYGLGVREVVARLSDLGCSVFFVATAAEGRDVRAVARDATIYVFSGVQADDRNTLLRHGLTPVMNHAGQLDLWRRYRERPIALHADTGMNRLGFTPDALERIDLSPFRLTLAMTHLACADVPDHPANARQRSLFAHIVRRLRTQFPDVATSVCNSAGVLSVGGEVGEVCRPGIALYGGNPFIAPGRELASVATLDACVLQMKTLKTGDSVGYGATYVARAPMTIALLGAGYADGVPRLASNRGAVAFGDRRLPIVGRVSMDTTTVDATEVAAAMKVGDRVSFFGDPSGVVRLEEVATWAETLSYEVLTGIGPRVERRFVG